jgi:hypothetical protein
MPPPAGGAESPTDMLEDPHSGHPSHRPASNVVSTLPPGESNTIVLAGPCPFLSLFSTRGHIADAPLHTHTPHHTTLLSLPHALSLSRPCLVCTERQPGSLWHVCTRVHTPVCHVCSFDGVARSASLTHIPINVNASLSISLSLSLISHLQRRPKSWKHSRHGGWHREPSTSRCSSTR